MAIRLLINYAVNKDNNDWAEAVLFYVQSSFFRHLPRNIENNNVKNEKHSNCFLREKSIYYHHK